MSTNEINKVEALFHKHCDTKNAANAAIKAIKKGFGVTEITEDVILNSDLNKLCNAKGVGRKTIILAAEVACDLYKKK